jgi:phasin family protein
MNIVEQLSGVAGKFQSQIDGYRAQAVEKARQRVKQAADVVSAARTPVKTLAQAGQRLNALTHDYVEQLLVGQSRAIEGLIDQSVERLQRLAQADSAKSLVRLQTELGAAGRKRLSRDAGNLWKIVADTGRDIGALASDTYAELVYGVRTVGQPVARRKPAKKTATKRARAKKSR